MGVKIRPARLRAAALLAVASISSLFVAMPDAAAAASCRSQHCYWIADWSVNAPSGFDGGTTNVRVNCAALANAQTVDFVTDELWVVSSLGWIEAGIVEGHPAGRPSTQNNTVLFWGHGNFSGGFVGHYGTGQISFGSYYRMAIHRTGSSTWDVRAGSMTSGLTAMSETPRSLETGMEAYTDSSTYVTDEGSSSSMTYYTLQNQEASGWHSSTGAQLGTPPNGYLRWADQYHWAQYGSGSCAAFSGQPQPSSSTKPDLLSVARDTARSFGESAPNSITTVSSSRAAALRAVAPGDTVNENGGAYVITMHGTFAGDAIPRPRGGAAPTGTVLSLVVDATSMQVTDYALGTTAPKLAALGTVSRLG